MVRLLVCLSVFVYVYEWWIIRKEEMLDLLGSIDAARDRRECRWWWE